MTPSNMTSKLGQFHRMDLRNVWLSEPQDFTPWLAQENNLKILGDALGIELELEAQEKNVGPFRADILCRSLDDDSLVLIENQLERTVYTARRQLLTYAAGCKASPAYGSPQPSQRNIEPPRIG